MTASLPSRRTVLAGALAVGPAHRARAAGTIRVAAVDAVSGPLGYSGLDTLRGAQVAADEINAAGGIRSMGGRILEVVPYDTRGEVDHGRAEAERAIAEGAVAILGTTHSSVTMATTAVAERAGIPHIVTGSSAPEITVRGFRCTFRVLVTSDMVFDSMLPSLQAVFTAGGAPLRSFVAVCEESAFGRSLSARYRLLTGNAGLRYGDLMFEPGTTGFSEIVARLSRMDVQLVDFTGYASDAVAFVQAMKEGNVDAGLLVPSVGVTDPAFMRAVGARDAEGFAGMQYFNPHVRPPGNPDGPRRFQEAYAKRFGEPGFLAGIGYTGLRTLGKALQDAGTSEPGRLRDALASVELRATDGHILPSKGVRFDAAGQNVAANVPYAQLIRGRLELVWPLEYATAVPKVPIPTWRQKAEMR